MGKRDYKAAKLFLPGAANFRGFRGCTLARMSPIFPTMENPVQSATSALIEMLQQRARNGSDRVWLTPAARRQLRELPEKIGQKSQKTPKKETEPPPSPQKLPKMTIERPKPENRPPPAPQAAPAAEILQPEGETKAEKLAWLRERAKNWEPAQELDSLRETMVFAVGNPDADLVFVGEAPGAEEERQREPFVGPAGQLLTKMIQAMGITRSDVYISNIVKFRPALPNQGQSNRKPTPEEMASCVAFVKAEIDVIRPKVVVALGGTAAEGLLGLTGSVSRMRSQFHDLGGIPTMVTYHPSYLLRNKQLTERRKVWEDMLLVMERVGLPITPKQQGFFKK